MSDMTDERIETVDEHGRLVVRDGKGQLVQGHKSGRPPGQTETERVRALIKPHREGIINALLAAVKEKRDVRAAELLLDRLVPKPRPVAERVHVPGMREASTLAGKVTAVLAAIAAGEVSADSGRAVLAALADAARIVTATELEDRIARLEGKERAKEITVTPVEPTEEPHDRF